MQAELGAGSIAVDAERGRAYCANMLASSVTVFDPATLRSLGRIAVRACPGKVVINQAAGYLYLASLLNDRLTCISLATEAVLDELPVERAPAGLCVSSDGRCLYVCNRDPGTISVLDARSGTESHRITVGSGLGDCAVDPVTGRLRSPTPAAAA